MKTKKTITQWFEEVLPSDIAQLAIENTDKKKLDNKCTSFRFSLSMAFIWGDTIQGYKYWYDIFSKYSH